MPDTVQWWIAPTGSWRIRTYGIDHDIHTHSVGNMDNLREVAIANTKKHYGDVIKSQYVIDLMNAFDADTADAAFRASGIEPRIEIVAGRFAFWKPDEARYHTQSQPH